MSRHDAQYIEEFQPALPQKGQIVSISFEWKGKEYTTYGLKYLIKLISEGNLPASIKLPDAFGIPQMNVDVYAPQPQQQASLNEEGRLEIIETCKYHN